MDWETDFEKLNCYVRSINCHASCGMFCQNLSLNPFRIWSNTIYLRLFSIQSLKVYSEYSIVYINNLEYNKKFWYATYEKKFCAYLKQSFIESNRV